MEGGSIAVFRSRSALPERGPPGPLMSSGPRASSRAHDHERARTRAVRKTMSWFHRKRTRELALVVCFLLPSLAIFFLYRILPLGWNAWLSVHAWSPLKAAQFVGLEHYEEMLLDDDVFWQALANTLIFIASSPLAIAAALGIAVLVNSDLRGAAVYRTIV